MKIVENFKYYLSRYKADTKRSDFPLSCKIQLMLQMIGIHVHNPIRDECCCDFECCADKHYRGFLHISAKMLPIRVEIIYVPTAPVGDENRTFKKVRKFKFFKS